MYKTASIDDYKLPHDTHNFYDVKFEYERNKTKIQTTVTNNSSVVDRWISALSKKHLLVGLAVERYSNTVATVQLCINRLCLIFQIPTRAGLPESLKNFLWNKNHTFFGVGIAEYGFNIANHVDLGGLAAEAEGGWPELRNVGLEILTLVVLCETVEKEEKITMSRWDNPVLSHEQVLYACIDAFLSLEIGKCLNADDTKKQCKGKRTSRRARVCRAYLGPFGFLGHY